MLTIIHRWSIDYPYIFAAEPSTFCGSTAPIPLTLRKSASGDFRLDPGLPHWTWQLAWVMMHVIYHRKTLENGGWPIFVIWLVVTETWILLFDSVGKFIIPIDQVTFFRGVGWNHQPVINQDFQEIHIWTSVWLPHQSWSTTLWSLKSLENIAGRSWRLSPPWVQLECPRVDVYITNWNDPPFCSLAMLSFMKYPIRYRLVNVYITMENHHYQWENSRNFFDQGFNSYVTVITSG